MGNGGGGALYTLLLAGSRFNCRVAGGCSGLLLLLLLLLAAGLGLLVVVDTGLSSYLPSLTSNRWPCHSYPFKMSSCHDQCHISPALIAPLTNCIASKSGIVEDNGAMAIGSSRARVCVNICMQNSACFSKQILHVLPACVQRQLDAMHQVSCLHEFTYQIPTLLTWSRHSSGASRGSLGGPECSYSRS